MIKHLLTCSFLVLMTSTTVIGQDTCYSLDSLRSVVERQVATYPDSLFSIAFEVDELAGCIPLKLPQAGHIYCTEDTLLLYFSPVYSSSDPIGLDPDTFWNFLINWQDSKTHSELPCGSLTTRTAGQFKFSFDGIDYGLSYCKEDYDAKKLFIDFLKLQ